MTKLEAKDLRLHAGTHAILNGIDVSIGAGEIVGLIGPNGAGKTTLLRALALLSAGGSGTITLDGVPLATLKPAERARRIAYVEQSGLAAWPVSVAHLVGLGRLPYRTGRNAAADDQAVRAALQATGCAVFAERAIDTLSAGERSRVLLARALAGQPQILLLDEPVAALDPAQQLAVMEVLGDLARRGIGIMAVLHDLPLASRFCNRLVLLQEGRVLAAGKPETVLHDDLLAQAFAIQPLRGAADGQGYVLPWRRL
jgi:iron complex transport system ATP-binding protein